MPELTFRPIEAAHDQAVCARMMASSEPWTTIGRSYEECLRAIADPSRERIGAWDADGIAGFILLNLGGPLAGYIQTVCVRQGLRGSGIGSSLIARAEERIFPLTPNVFLFVSSFNHGARRLYERLGYQRVGEVPDYLIRGASEILMRKTRGPLYERK